MREENINSLLSETCLKASVGHLHCRYSNDNSLIIMETDKSFVLWKGEKKREQACIHVNQIPPPTKINICNYLTHLHQLQFLYGKKT